MKRQKRDPAERAFIKGYQAGIDGRSRSVCPHESSTARQQWLSGWRESRTDQMGWIEPDGANSKTKQPTTNGTSHLKIH